jgi:hypothetical protein
MSNRLYVGKPALHAADESARVAFAPGGEVTNVAAVHAPQAGSGGLEASPGFLGALPQTPGFLGALPQTPGFLGALPQTPGFLGALPQTPGGRGGGRDGGGFGQRSRW